MRVEVHLKRGVEAGERSVMKLQALHAAHPEVMYPHSESYGSAL